VATDRFVEESMTDIQKFWAMAGCALFVCSICMICATMMGEVGTFAPPNWSYNPAQVQISGHLQR
jgi:hypothetical protein